MKLNYKNLLNDKFVRGTFFITIASFISAIFAFLVHPFLSRRISISEYGDFQALLSFLTFLGILGTVAVTTITKEVAVLSVDEPNKIKGLHQKFLRASFLFGVIIFLVVFFTNNYLSNLFNISKPYILVLTALNLIYVFPYFVNRAVLIGMQKFSDLSINALLDSVFRLIFIVILVTILPYKLAGAALAIAFGSVVAFAYSFWQIKKLRLIKGSKKIKISNKIWRYSFLVLWFTAVTQFFYNFDMLFVKSIFNPNEAGLYAAILTIGRIIFFVGSSIPLVLFPVIASQKNNPDTHKYIILVKSIGLMGVLTIPSVLFISVFPEFITRIMVGAQYLPITPYLPLFSVTMLSLTLLTVISQYFLALSKHSGLVILSIGALVEIFVLKFFHLDFWQIIWSMLAVFTITNFILIGLCFNDYLKDKK